MTSFEPLAIRLCLSPARLTVREHLSGARSLVPLKPDLEWLVPLPEVAQAAMHGGVTSAAPRRTRRCPDLCSPRDLRE